MTRSRATFGKLQRERDKQAKAKAKRERRLVAADESAQEDPTEPHGAPTEEPQVVLAMIEELHIRFEKSEVSFEEYEVEKAALLGRLTIE